MADMYNARLQKISDDHKKVLEKLRLDHQNKIRNDERKYLDLQTAYQEQRYQSEQVLN